MSSMFEEYEFPEASVFRGFEPDTFAFLGELRLNNTPDWMATHEERYQRVLREPLRALFRALAPVAARLNPTLETNVKYGRMLSSIRRRWPGEAGTYHDSLWGAFFRADHTRQTDAQLSITVRESGVTVGVGLSAGADEVLAACRVALAERAGEFAALVMPLLAEGCALHITHGDSALVIDDPGQWAAFAALAPHALDGLAVAYTFTASDDLLWQPLFADEAGRWLERLYPVYRFLIGESPSPHELHDQRDLHAEAQPRARQPYTFAQLAAETLLAPDMLRRMLTLLDEKGQIVLHGPPGTGKTFIARRLAQVVIGEHGAARMGELRLVQFHPSYAYEEFIEGIRPHSEDGQVTYPVEPGVFRVLCDVARAHPDRAYVLIIDEINRGNLPRIFGELLYLLDYRDPTEAVILPYSKSPFTLPQNVKLIGTMNTADRTVAALDQAVRRRFHFIALRPDPDVLRGWLRAQGNERMAWVAGVLAALNQQLDTDGIDATQHIGHSLFMVRGLDEQRLALIWEHSILPLLEDCFYNRTGWEGRYRLEALRGQP
jgi:uncharacterized protein (DUF2461 family)